MNRVREVDPLDFTITVEAGCILAEVQRAAAAVDRLFPLSLAAEGSCQIGGNLSTNAGGTTVLRYGNARDLVLGLEVVLPDGTVWDGLRRLRKDNRGYDLKQLFLGAEGTLGIITAAVLKLFPQPSENCTALVAVADPASATRLLARFRDRTGDAVTSFEYLNRVCMELVLEHLPGTADPFDRPHPHYVLVDLASGGGVILSGGSRIHDFGDKGGLVFHVSVVFIIVKALGVQAANFASAGHEPEPIALHQRRATNALQRPIMHATGDQFFAAVLPQKVTRLFIEGQQAPQVDFRRISGQVSGAVVRADENTAVGDNRIAVSLAAELGVPANVFCFTVVPVSGTTIEFSDVPFEWQVFCARHIVLFTRAAPLRPIAAGLHDLVGRDRFASSIGWRRFRRGPFDSLGGYSLGGYRRLDRCGG